MRSAVVLPQPDGPTTTMSSASSIDEVELVDGQRPVVVDLRDLLERDLSHARSFRVRSRSCNRYMRRDASRGGARASSTRSIPVRSPTQTVTGSAISRASPRSSTTCEWLGVAGIWLNPINPSPNVDWGYDVADYTDVHPDLGSLADVDRLVAEAAPTRNPRAARPRPEPHVRTSIPWFRERPDFYVWADEVPNNWQAIFGGGSAWELDEDARTLLPAQLRQGAAGPRLVEPRGPGGVRADPPLLVRPRHRRLPDRRCARARSRIASFATTSESACAITPMNRPETHEIYRDWRRLADAYEPAAGAARRGLRPRHPGLGRVLRLGLGRAQPRVQLRARPRRPRRRADARGRRPHGGSAAAGRLALLDRVEPRRRPPHDSLVRRRRGSRPLRAAHAR